MIAFRCAVSALFFVVAASAQDQPWGAGGVPIGGAPSGPGGRGMTQDEISKLGDYVDQSGRLTKEDKAKGKTVADLLADDKAAAVKLAGRLVPACVVADAFLAAMGPATVDGKQVDTKTYEVSCANGMGYFLIAQDPQPPSGFSCFSAEVTHAADIAQHRKPSAVCRIPGSVDTKAMATTVLNRAGTACTVKNLKWLGVSSAAKVEFVELACDSGAGYILKSAVPGSPINPMAIGCKLAAAQGLPCTLTKSN
jgi:hypothetical protein